MLYGLVRVSAGDKHNLGGPIIINAYEKRTRRSAEKPDATFTWLTDIYKKILYKEPKIFLDRQKIVPTLWGG